MWNLTVLLMDSASFFFGIAVFDAAVVVPILLAKLHAPLELIGATYLIQVLGFTVPAMVAAHYIHGRPNHKKFMLLTGGIGRALIITLPFALIVAAPHHPTLCIVWILCAVAGFWFLDGCCAVSWTDIVAKTIVPKLRGLFFGTLQMLGGFSGFAAGAVVFYVLKTGEFQNYAILAGLWALGGMGSFFALSLIREPAGVLIDDEDKPGFWQFVGEGGRLFRRNQKVRIIIVSRWLLGANGLALPFYAVYSQQNLGVAAGTVGIYIGVRSIGRISAGPLWGWVSHRRGPALAVRWVSVLVAVAPAVAIFVFQPTAYLMAVVFFVQGITDDGLWTSCQNALYECVTDRERPLAVGAVSVALAPVALYGVFGGVIVQLVGYKPSFALASALGVLGAIVAWRLPSVRASAGLPTTTGEENA